MHQHFLHKRKIGGGKSCKISTSNNTHSSGSEIHKRKIGGGKKFASRKGVLTLLSEVEYVGVTEQRTVLKDATTKDVPIMLFEEEYVVGMAPLNTEQRHNMHRR